MFFAVDVERDPSLLKTEEPETVKDDAIALLMQQKAEMEALIANMASQVRGGVASD